MRPHHFGRDDLEQDGTQAAGNAGEESRDDEGQVAHPLRAVADEFDPLRVVPHGVENASERRTREGEHQGDADEGVDSYQVVHLRARPETDAKERLAHDPVARDAGFAAKELGEHQRHGEYQLGHAQRDHGKGRTGLARRDITEQHGKGHAREAADDRQQADRDRQAALADHVQSVNGHVGAQTRVHSMTEAQHAALPQEHVVGQAGDDGDAHLREHGHRQAAGKYPGRRQQDECEEAPDDPAADVVGFEFVVVLGHGLTPPACRADPWAGRSGSGPGRDREGWARPATA